MTGRPKSCQSGAHCGNLPPKGSKFCNQCGTSFPFRDCEDKDSVDVKFLKAMSVDLCFSLTEKQQLIVHSARPFPERGRVPSVFVFILGRLGARSLQATSVLSCKEYLTIVSSAECAGQILVHRFPARARILVHRSTAISRQLAEAASSGGEDSNRVPRVESGVTYTQLRPCAATCSKHWRLH